MNINYAQIIETANARKDALEALARRMKDFPEQAQKLSDALVFFAYLKNDVEFLDTEARGMVKEILPALDYVTEQTRKLATSLNYTSPSMPVAHFADLRAYMKGGA